MTHLADTFAVSQLGTAQEAVDKLFDLRSRQAQAHLGPVQQGVLNVFIRIS